MFFNEENLKGDDSLEGGEDAHVRGGALMSSPTINNNREINSINYIVDFVDDASKILINSKYQEQAKEIIQFLRKLTGRNYQFTQNINEVDF